MIGIKEFEAKPNRQLGICLRVLADEKIDETVIKTVLNEKGQIRFRILVNIEDEFYERLKQRYQYIRS